MTSWHLDPQSPINPDADRYANTCLELSQAVAARGSCVLDVPYGPDPEHRLDIYLAASPPREAVPVLVFFHGGGFTHGRKEWCGFMAPAVAPAILVAVRYRRVPSVAYPVPWLDAVAAVAWVRAHIAAHGGDTGRIVVGGHSAGGAIAATIRARPDWLAEHGLDSTAIWGTLCLSTTFHAFAVTGTPVSNYAPTSGPLVLDPRSPLARAADAAGSYFIAWGGRERQRERVERSGMAMISTLRDRGLPVEWRFLDDADHFGTHLAFADVRHPWSAAVREWLTRVR